MDVSWTSWSSRIPEDAVSLFAIERSPSMQTATMYPADYENASDTNIECGQVSASSGKTTKRTCRWWGFGICAESSVLAAPPVLPASHKTLYPPPVCSQVHLLTAQSRAGFLLLALAIDTEEIVL
jgi:hypothetical protein